MGWSFKTGSTAHVCSTHGFRLSSSAVKTPAVIVEINDSMKSSSLLAVPTLAGVGERHGEGASVPAGTTTVGQRQRKTGRQPTEKEKEKTHKVPFHRRQLTEDQLELFP